MITNYGWSIRHLQFNVCDQYLRDRTSICYNTSPDGRAQYINHLVQYWEVNAISFQEMCLRTYVNLLNYLGNPWTGYFYHTVSVPPTRCSGSTSWGIAVMVKTGISAPYTLPLPMDPNEPRFLHCGNATIYSGFRICTTHLTPDPHADQVAAVGDKTRYWALQRHATIIGGDFNININSQPDCSQANRMKPLYTGYFGKGVWACGPGTNHYNEVDNQNVAFPPYDEATSGNSKFDYTFMNSSRFYSTTYPYYATTVGTTISDHDMLRGFMTIHDDSA